MVTLPQDEFEAILERAAGHGARHALCMRSGSMARMRRTTFVTPRNLLDAFNEAKKTAGLTIINPIDDG